MPKTKKTQNEQEESKLKTKKNTAKNSNKKKNEVEKSKKTSAKKPSLSKKATQKKSTTKKSSEEKKNVVKTSTSKSSVKKEAEKKNNIQKVDEETVIDKIKNFLSKIALMQEELQKENEDKKKNKIVKENKKKTEKSEKPKYMLEYYDLPYRYNETVVKVLAQTPKKLFVYWDISDVDKEKYLKAFGEDFFYKTYPVLLLYNEDKNYVKEIVVNDFANSWYIDIDDPKTKYTIQLGRKFKNKPEIVNLAEFEQNHIILHTDYLPFAQSNEMEAPNDHVLLESLPRFFIFKNVKTNQEITKDFKSFKDTFGNNYNVEEFYKNQYENELSDGMFDMSNPSSGVNSSYFK